MPRSPAPPLRETLGVVLAGGMASRFGSDKALAALDGRTLLDHAVTQLALWCGDVVIAGRMAGPAPGIPDWPRPGMGPLSGLAAGLRHARDHGFATVISCGVDSIGLPENLPALLSPAPACLASQPVVGLWPVAALPVLEEILTGDGRHSLRQLAEAAGARLVETSDVIANVNTPEDLAVLRLARQDRATRKGEEA